MGRYEVNPERVSPTSVYKKPLSNVMVLVRHRLVSLDECEFKRNSFDEGKFPERELTLT